MTSSETSNSYTWLLWLAIPVVVIGTMVYYLANTPGETFPQPRVLDANAQGILLELPIVSAGKTVSWQPEWVVASAPANKAVDTLLQKLKSQTDAAITIEVFAAPGSKSQEQLSQRFDKILSSHKMGSASIQKLEASEQEQQGVVVNCNLADYELAKKLLGALSPYLGGKVALFYDEQLPAQKITVFLYGQPYFNNQGQSTFDPALYEE